MKRAQIDSLAFCLPVAWIARQPNQLQPPPLELSAEPTTQQIRHVSVQQSIKSFSWSLYLLRRENPYAGSCRIRNYFGCLNVSKPLICVKSVIPDSNHKIRHKNGRDKTSITELD